MSMKKIILNDPETRSADVVAENLEHLKVLFPEAFTEGKVDFEVLRQLLGDVVEEREEKYGLRGPGRRGAGDLCLEEERSQGRLEIPQETDEALPWTGCDHHGSAKVLPRGIA